MPRIRILKVNIKVADLVHIPLTVHAFKCMNLDVNELDIEMQIMSEPIPTGATPQQLTELGNRFKESIKAVQNFDATIPEVIPQKEN